MNSRLKDIDNIVNSIVKEEDYKKKIFKKVNYFENKYKNELLGYTFVKSLKELYELKSAGYIRYFNKNDDIRFGGILIKVFENETNDDFYKKNLIIIQNSYNKKWIVSWENNIIFYKKQTKKGDNLRNLFITYLDKDGLDKDGLDKDVKS